MFCPRCGTQVTETTKFCRSCGLPLLPVNNFVSSGGTMPLTPGMAEEPPSRNPLTNIFGDFTPKQRMIMTIIALVFSPAIFAVLGEALGSRFLGEAMPAIAGVLLVPGIIYAVMRYKNQERKMAQRQAMPPLAQPIITPQQFSPNTTYQPPIPPQYTNPLADSPVMRGSVTEEETQRLPQPPRQKE